MSDALKPVAWIANDPDGGPYLTRSESAARNYPDPIPLVPATTLATLQDKLVEKDAEMEAAAREAFILHMQTLNRAEAAEATAARLQAESGDVAKAVAAEREAIIAVIERRDHEGHLIWPDAPGLVSAIRTVFAIRTRAALQGESDG